jgi:hypothetical protein
MVFQIDVWNAINLLQNVGATMFIKVNVTGGVIRINVLTLTDYYRVKERNLEYTYVGVGNGHHQVLDTPEEIDVLIAKAME